MFLSAPAPPEVSTACHTLSRHDALPISRAPVPCAGAGSDAPAELPGDRSRHSRRRRRQRPSLAMPIFVEQGPASGAVPEGEREARVERAAGPTAERLGDVGVADGEIAGPRLHLRAAAE